MAASSRRDASSDSRQRLGRNRRTNWVDELAAQFTNAIVAAATRSLQNGVSGAPSRATKRKVDGRRLQRLKTMRKAIEWEIQLETGQVASRAAIAKREGISRATVTQTLRLLGADAGPSAGRSTSTAPSRKFETSGSFERALDRAALVSENAEGRGYRELRKEVLRRFESEYLPRVLLDAENNISAAASIAGIDRKHLWRLLKRNGF